MTPGWKETIRVDIKGLSIILLVALAGLVVVLSACSSEQPPEETTTVAGATAETVSPTETEPTGPFAPGATEAVGATTVEPAEITATATEGTDAETAPPPTENAMVEPTTTEEETNPLEPLTNPTVALVPVVEGLAAPIALAPIPDSGGQMLVADQVGLVYVVDPEQSLQDEPFLDIRDRMVELNPGYDERGLLGLALHPDYALNGRLFVYYSAPLQSSGPTGWNHTSRVSEFRVSEGNPQLAEPTSEAVILEVHQPQSNHNGGQIAFGPDGYLYIPLGDGGGGNDIGEGHVSDWYEANSGGNAQNITENLLGSIVRLDVDSSQPYTIPEDNPFVNSEGLDEIWAYGFRNPYRISFAEWDGKSLLFVSDAGQDMFEEVSLVERGGNYGWNVYEGRHCFNAAQPTNPLDDCPDSTPDGTPLTLPIIEYPNFKTGEGIGLVVVGGYLYTGSGLEGFQGHYIFADWSTSFGRPDGTLLVASPSGEGQLWEWQRIRVTGASEGSLGFYILSFGQDENGEIYLLGSRSSGPAGNSGVALRLEAP